MSRQCNAITVVGAGSLGCMVALFLDRFGFEVTLLESEDDILRGASQVSFVNHGDGFEYYKRNHKRTGETCIEGALVKALIFPSSFLATDVCNRDNPIRFYVSEGSVKKGLITPAGFIANATYMWKHYSHMYHALRRACGLSDEQAESVLGGAPRTFMSELSPEYCSQVNSAVVGVAGNCLGINMPHYYALLKAALRESRVIVRYSERLTRVVPEGGGGYRLKLARESLLAQQIVVCAAHHIPKLAALASGGNSDRGLRGVFYLNSMTFLRLPATSDTGLLTDVRRISFTLMEQDGGMYACIVPPTTSHDGLAAIYYPHSIGSHIAASDADRACPPDEWDERVENGLDNANEHVVNTVAHIRKLYGFLAGYGEVSHTGCRTVFNSDVRGSDGGRDRRVRELEARHHQLTSDGLVTGWAAPKWTSVELAALMAVDYVLQRSGRKPLKKCAHHGCGPTRIDVVSVLKTISFQHQKARSADAKRYARISRLPERIVCSDHPRFTL